MKSYLTLCDPIDGSPPSSHVPGILQARILEGVAISFSNAWKWKVKVKSLSRVQLLATPWTAAYQAPLSMGFSKQEYWSGLPFPSLLVPWAGNDPGLLHWELRVFATLDCEGSPTPTVSWKSFTSCVHAKSLQSCPTLCNPMDCSLPGSSVHGIFQAIVLEWIVISFSRGSSHPRDWTCISYFSCIASGFFTTNTTWETLLPPKKQFFPLGLLLLPHQLLIPSFSFYSYMIVIFDILAIYPFALRPNLHLQSLE